MSDASNSEDIYVCRIASGMSAESRTGVIMALSCRMISQSKNSSFSTVSNSLPFATVPVLCQVASSKAFATTPDWNISGLDKSFAINSTSQSMLAFDMATKAALTRVEEMRSMLPCSACRCSRTFSWSITIDASSAVNVRNILVLLSSLAFDIC
ncbi:hypothetical protein KCU85_g125, partial [Aureobasidium melanogenum]